VLPGKSKGSRLAFPRTAKVGADSWLRWRSRLPVRYRIRSLETVGGAYNCGAWYAARNNTDPLLLSLVQIDLASSAMSAFGGRADIKLTRPRLEPVRKKRWCAYYDLGEGGATNCGFSTYQQCLATVSGIGGSCGPDPRSPGLYLSTKHPRRHSY
jgi:hypothetical protein